MIAPGPQKNRKEQPLGEKEIFCNFFPVFFRINSEREFPELGKIKVFLFLKFF